MAPSPCRTLQWRARTGTAARKVGSVGGQQRGRQAVSWGSSTEGWKCWGAATRKAGSVGGQQRGRWAVLGGTNTEGGQCQGAATRKVGSVGGELRSSCPPATLQPHAAPRSQKPPSVWAVSFGTEGVMPRQHPCSRKLTQPWPLVPSTSLALPKAACCVSLRPCPPRALTRAFNAVALKELHAHRVQRVRALRCGAHPLLPNQTSSAQMTAL